jgi:hypothetical protein
MIISGFSILCCRDEPLVIDAAADATAVGVGVVRVGIDDDDGIESDDVAGIDFFTTRRRRL